jgi:hypothetical protein
MVASFLADGTGACGWVVVDWVELASAALPIHLFCPVLRENLPEVAEN